MSPLIAICFVCCFSSHILGLCIIESILKGESSITLMSPNYPLGFPEDELMTWQFVIPPNMRASVFFHNYSLSNCERKEERVEYYLPGSFSNPEVFKLSDSQPANIAGSFNLSLQGCDQDAQNPGILRLLFQVVVQHPQVDESEYLPAPSRAFTYRHLGETPQGREILGWVFFVVFFLELWSLFAFKEVGCQATLRPVMLPGVPLAVIVARWTAMLKFAICDGVQSSIIDFTL